MSEILGYKEPLTKEVAKRTLKNTTAPNCGYINPKRKRGLGYLTEMTVDTGYGIITGINCYPANYRESDIVLNHVKQQQDLDLMGHSDISVTLNTYTHVNLEDARKECYRS